MPEADETIFRKLLEMCDRIAEGDSVQVAALSVGVAYRTFYNYLGGGYGAMYADTLMQAYARARKVRADARAEQIDEIIRRTMLPRGDEEYLEPNAARVVIDAIKWQASKENNARYGDKLAIESEAPKAGLGRADALALMQSGAVTIEQLMDRWTKPVEAIEAPKTEDTAQDADDSDIAGLAD
jgi:hypothetical protein